MGRHKQTDTVDGVWPNLQKPYRTEFKSDTGDKVTFGNSAFEILDLTQQHIIEKASKETKFLSTLENSLKIVKAAVGNRPISEREEFIACAFINLGMDIGKLILAEPKYAKFLRKLNENHESRSKGGKKSKYEPYSKSILKVVDEYLDGGKSQGMAIWEIGQIVDNPPGPPSISTFNDWLRKRRKNESIW